ncbi:MAG: hypothetical protein ACLU4J_02785 [Butyricimonas paravirosa]
MNKETYILLDVPMSKGLIGYTHNYYRIPVNYRIPLDENDKSTKRFINYNGIISMIFLSR